MQDSNGKPLSNKEFQIAYLIAHGRTMRSVAGQMGLSYWSVASYLRRIKAKLGTRDAIELHGLWQKGAF